MPAFARSASSASVARAAKSGAPCSCAIATAASKHRAAWSRQQAAAIERQCARARDRHRVLDVALPGHAVASWETELASPARRNAKGRFLDTE
jgi:hypothetical protein